MNKDNAIKILQSNKVALLRWIQLPISYVIQVIFMTIYPILHLVWKFFVFKKFDNVSIPNHEIVELKPEFSRIRDEVFHDNHDGHGTYSHIGLHIACPEYGEKALRLLFTKDGKFLRKYAKDDIYDWCPSSDVVVFWCFSFALLPDNLKPIDLLEKAAKSYLKHLGAFGNIDGKDGVSKRCGNFGLMYNSDGWCGPASGHQYYNSAAIFALAAKYLGGYWKYIFWIHWLLYGGWYWKHSPVIYPGGLQHWLKWLFSFGFLRNVQMPKIRSDGTELGYVRDVTMKALFVLKTCFGPRDWILQPMYFITDTIASHENALFYALIGREWTQRLPAVLTISAWQRVDATNFHDEMCNIWLHDALYKIKELSKKYD